MKNGRYEEGGSVLWYKDDVVHRLDGPAIEYGNGDKAWRVNGKLHRLDGPAIEWANGGRSWFVNGVIHRLEGPAIEGTDGTKFWFVNGQEVDIIAIFGKEPSVPLSDDEQMLLLLSH